MGIDTYLAVAFWMGILRLVCRGFLMITADYPRTTKTSATEETLLFIVSAFFLAWISYLRFYA